MAKYCLSNIAKNDLKDIARWGDRKYGTKRSNQYRDNLKKHFRFLAENPLLYPPVDDLRIGYRRSVCGVHSKSKTDRLRFCSPLPVLVETLI